MKLNLLSITLATAFFLGSAPLVHADLITNPKFETGDLSGWSLTGAHSAASDNGIYYGVDAEDAHSGVFGAYFGTPGATQTLSQVFATTPGTTYTVSFWLAQLPAAENPYTNFVEVALDTAVLYSQTRIPAQGFVQYSFSQRVTSASTRLAFTFRDDVGFFSLDDIAISGAGVATPEPATYFPLAALFIALVFMKSRCPKQGLS